MLALNERTNRIIDTEARVVVDHITSDWYRNRSGGETLGLIIINTDDLDRIRLRRIHRPESSRRAVSFTPLDWTASSAIFGVMLRYVTSSMMRIWYRGWEMRRRQRQDEYSIDGSRVWKTQSPRGNTTTHVISSNIDNNTEQIKISWDRFTNLCLDFVDALDQGKALPKSAAGKIGLIHRRSQDQSCLSLL